MKVLPFLRNVQKRIHADAMARSRIKMLANP